MDYYDLTSAYLRSRFPELETLIAECEAIEDTSPYGLFYNVLFRQVYSLQQSGEAREAKKYFDFIEDLLLAAKDMPDLPRTENPINNLVQTGFLEYCWDTMDMYVLAKRTMGTQTGILFEKCGAYLNIPKDNSAKHFT